MQGAPLASFRARLAAFALDALLVALVLRVPAWFSRLEAGFGFLQYFTHPNHQTVHARIAETIVVVTPRPAKPSARSRP